MLPVRIAGTASILPGRAVSTAELLSHLAEPRPLDEVLARTGIASRWWADPDTTNAEVAAAALRDALAVAGMPATALRRIIFVSSIGGDVTLPATANHIAVALGLSGTCDCFDLNNSCLGFLTAFDIAARALATGGGPVGICVVELPSRRITPEHPRPYLVFGDAAAAAVLDRGRDGEGMLASWLRNDGLGGGDVLVGNPAVTGVRETVQFPGRNKDIASDAIAWVKRGVDAVLTEAGLALADIQWVLPHQPNGSLFAAIVRELDLDRDRLFPVVHEIGSVGAAAIPTSLDRLCRSGRLRDGDRILVVGVGAGISAGAMIVQVRV